MIKDICYAMDNNYAHLMGTSMASVLEHYKGVERLSFHIICHNVDEDNIERLKAIGMMKNAEVIIYRINMEEYITRKPVKSSYPDITFARIFISDILSEEVETVLYLDSDTIIVEDISPLLSKTFDEPNCIIGFKDIDGDEHLKKLKVTQAKAYINSGVMLIDLKKWREEDISKRIVLGYYDLQEEPFFCDQDLINMFCAEEIDCHSGYIFNSLGYIDDFSLKTIKAHGVVVVHYAGYEYRSRRKDLMKAINFYRDKTPWKSIEIEDLRTWQQRIRTDIRVWLYVNCRPLYDIAARFWKKWRSL